MDFTVIGQGVIGLTSALMLAERGYSVEVVADRPREATASSAACAVWLPIFVPGGDGPPGESGPGRVRRWAAQTYEAFCGMEGTHRGVRPVDLIRFGASDADRPDVGEIVGELRVHSLPHLPAEMRLAWRFPSFVIEMDTYLGSLDMDLVGHHVDICTGVHFASLGDAVTRSAGSVVLNCTGLGSAQLCQDSRFRPVKGVVLSHCQGSLGVILSAGSFVMAPRSDCIALGAGYFSEYDSEEPLPEEVDTIFAFHDRWREMDLSAIDVTVPEIRADRITRAVGGLRPIREGGVRLEAEEIHGKTVVHNYGHGGAGVTLSWGAAHEAVGLAIAAWERTRS
ncbi:FAD-dependent oxidoreductase [Streptomyces sp. DSM 118148]|uniref:FAD-dependent oxidoreductase n=1 Tax=Streptomyces sp. DSM 118148 TaxID=3448667 RepID=UPI0040403625